MTHTSGDHSSNDNCTGSGDTGTSGSDTRTGAMESLKNEDESTSSKALTMTEGKGKEDGGAGAGQNNKVELDPDPSSSPPIISNSKLRNSEGTPVAPSTGMELETSSLSQSSSLSSYLPKGVPTCSICPEPCIYFCKSCKKAGYCSKEHQKAHWKLHRPYCYPVMVQVNSLHGSHLVVTRDVRRGEVILREKPLLIAPFFVNPPTRKGKWKGSSSSSEDNSTSKISMYLACHKLIFSGTCSKCGWPVCSEQCEKNPTHAAQECKIFAEYPVPSSGLCDRPTQYLLVALLRMLLLGKGEDYQHCTSASPPTDHDPNPKPRSSDTCKYTQFMEVVRRQLPLQDVNNSHLARSPQSSSASAWSGCCSCSTDLISKSLGSIISQRFSLTDAEIDQMVGALRTSSFITADGNSNNGREESYPNGWGFDFSYSNNNCNLGDDNADHDGDDDATAANVSGSRSRGKRLCVYHLGSMLTSNCIPNCGWLIHNSMDLYLRASSPIKMGERLTITYVDPLLPTWERSRLLWQEKVVSCACARCTDPTESCTFFSAIKCPGKNEERSECEGYLLPTDPLAVAYSRRCGRRLEGSCCCCFSEMEEKVDHDHDDVGADERNGEKLCEGLAEVADWKCNVCLMRQPWDFIRNKLDGMRNLFLQDVSFTTGNNNKAEGREHENLEDVELILAKIDNFVGKRTTHLNHFMVVRMEQEVLGRISRLLEGGQVPFNQMERWALKMIEMCKKGLKVVNVLCPGLNRERGRLLYFLQQALVINLMFKISRAMRSQLQPPCKESLSHEELTKRFQEVLLARKEVHEIFALAEEGENAEERKMLKAVQHDSIEMRLLKKHFKYHQNNINGHNNVLIGTTSNKYNCANPTVL